MKNIDATTLAEVAKQTDVYPIQLVKIDVTNNNADSLFLTTCYRHVSYDSNTYLAGNNVLNLSMVEETKDVKTNAITVQLAGIPNTVIAALENVDAIGGKVTIFQAFFSTVTNQIVGQVYEKWQGIINSHSVEEGNETFEETVTINIECKSIVGAILNTKSGRFTSQTSMDKHNPGDKSMEFVASTINFSPFFGREED